MHVCYLFSNILYFSNSGKACFSVEVFNENVCTHCYTLFKLGYLTLISLFSSGGVSLAFDHF